jgi:hypothetical protein
MLHALSRGLDVTTFEIENPPKFIYFLLGLSVEALLDWMRKGVFLSPEISLNCIKSLFNSKLCGDLTWLDFDYYLELMFIFDGVLRTKYGKKEEKDLPRVQDIILEILDQFLTYECVTTEKHLYHFSRLVLNILQNNIQFQGKKKFYLESNIRSLEILKKISLVPKSKNIPLFLHGLLLVIRSGPQEDIKILQSAKEVFQQLEDEDALVLNAFINSLLLIENKTSVLTIAILFSLEKSIGIGAEKLSEFLKKIINSDSKDMKMISVQCIKSILMVGHKTISTEKFDYCLKLIELLIVGIAKTHDEFLYELMVNCLIAVYKMYPNEKFRLILLISLIPTLIEDMEKRFPGKSLEFILELINIDSQTFRYFLAALEGNLMKEKLQQALKENMEQKEAKLSRERAEAQKAAPSIQLTLNFSGFKLIDLYFYFIKNF